MIHELCYLWNSMTGSKSVPHKEFVQEIFSIFDTDDDGIVTFEDFNLAYRDDFQMMGWFEFLNNDEINIQSKLLEWEQDNKIRRRNTTLKRKPEL